MLVVIAILMAIIAVLILVMISSVYQMNRDLRRKITDLTQKYIRLDHIQEYQQKTIDRLEKIATMEGPHDTDSYADSGGGINNPLHSFRSEDKQDNQ